jgi:hypothetical protein
LNGGLVTQMAVRAMRIIGGIRMMPIADDAGSKNQQRNQRQRNPEYTNRLPHNHFGGVDTRNNPPGNSNVMWDARKALPVTLPLKIKVRRSGLATLARPRNRA